MEVKNTNYPDISLRRQCELLSLPRSSFYYSPTIPDTPNLAHSTEANEAEVLVIRGNLRLDRHAASCSGWATWCGRADRVVQALGEDIAQIHAVCGRRVAIPRIGAIGRRVMVSPALPLTPPEQDGREDFCFPS